VLCQKNGQPLRAHMLAYLLERARRARQGSQPVTSRGTRDRTSCDRRSARTSRCAAPARAVQKLAGHRDLGTTQRYMHLSPLAIEAAIRLLELPPSAAERATCGQRPKLERR